MTVAPEVGADHLTMLDVSPPDLVSVAREAEVVVNATPLGMKGGDPLPLGAEHLDEGRAVCDAVYRPGRETALVRKACARGARVVTGKGMLLYQGVLAQRLWTGRGEREGDGRRDLLNASHAVPGSVLGGLVSLLVFAGAAFHQL